MDIYIKKSNIIYNLLQKDKYFKKENITIEYDKKFQLYKLILSNYNDYIYIFNEDNYNIIKQRISRIRLNNFYLCCTKCNTFEDKKIYFKCFKCKYILCNNCQNLEFYLGFGEKKCKGCGYISGKKIDNHKTLLKKIDKLEKIQIKVIEKFN